MYSTFIFDLDGTLLDTLGDLAASTNYALRTHGLPERSVDEPLRIMRCVRMACLNAQLMKCEALSEMV